VHHVAGSASKQGGIMACGKSEYINRNKKKPPARLLCEGGTKHRKNCSRYYGEVNDLMNQMEEKSVQGGDGEVVKK
jgi:hypothetical protein